MPSNPPALHPLKLPHPRPVPTIPHHQQLLSIFGQSPKNILYRNRSLKQFFEGKSVLREERAAC
jgi:hypothetical protein